MNYVSEENIIKIMQGISKKVPQGIMLGNNPIGTIISFMGNTPPEDYLACDGTVYNIADYQELADFFEIEFSASNYFGGDGTTTFAVPDLRGEFLRGTGTNSHTNQGSGSSVGTHQDGTEFPNINTWSTVLYKIRASSEMSSGISKYDSGVGSINDAIKVNMSVESGSGGDKVSFTSRPTNTSVLYCIKYRTSTSVFNTINAGRFVATAPSYYQREDLFTTNKTSITIKPTWININGNGYVLTSNKTIDLTNTSSWDNSTYATASNRAGKDFYVYALQTSGIEPNFILSANSTVPTGYTASNSRKIGGFHCLCLSVGTISGHTLSGYVTGDILPLSPWDLSFRAVSENEGMVYIPQIGLWADIYLGSWDGSKLVSVYNGVPVTGTSTKAMHGIMFAEEYGLVNKFLPSYDEFIVCAKGTPKGDHLSTGAAPTGTGGHTNTGSSRIISNYGLEDCVGVLWQWSRTLAENYPNSTWNSANYNLDGYVWQDNPVYNSTVDSIKRGSCVGLLRRLLLGGGYGDAVSNCSSRTVRANIFGTRLSVDISGRAFSMKR